MPDMAFYKRLVKFRMPFHFKTGKVPGPVQSFFRYTNCGDWLCL